MEVCLFVCFKQAVSTVVSFRKVVHDLEGDSEGFYTSDQVSRVSCCVSHPPSFQTDVLSVHFYFFLGVLFLFVFFGGYLPNVCLQAHLAHVWRI